MITTSKTQFYFLLIAGTFAMALPKAQAETLGDVSRSILSRFDHDMHSEKVFLPQKFSCGECHNVKVAPGSKQIVLEEELENKTFRAKSSELCHKCHRTTDPQHSTAPKTCYTCHQSVENLNAIKPMNHSNVAWKQNHATEARIRGGECLNCHTNSTCVKCHLQRNDIYMKNHERNFRFYHSVQARLEPYRCDSCHTKSYCTKCHLGGK